METVEKQPIIRMFHVIKRFEKNNALMDVTLDIYKNDFIFLCGPSGAGKSTFLKLLYANESLSEGQILVEGMNLSRIHRRTIPELRRKFGIIFQDFKLIPSKTVYENVALVLEAKGEKEKWVQKKVHRILSVVGMEKKKDIFPSSLSGGEQQRIAVARAVVGDPKIILADEPTGSLDRKSAGIIMDLIFNFHARGTTVIMATHDEEHLTKKKQPAVPAPGGSPDKYMNRSPAIIIKYLQKITNRILKKGYLNNVAVLTIALSVFIVATFFLFLINTNEMVQFMKMGVRVMVYLESDLSQKKIDAVHTKIKEFPDVGDVVFISKKEGMNYLKERLPGQLSLFEDLKENPLPDAFEITLSGKTLDLSGISLLAAKTKALRGVESVEYGQAWLHRFTNIFKLFQFATFGIAGLFFMASVFIIGNTIRLILYSKREEIEIMRLVGASESFIKKPFYVEGIIMGALGGGWGLLAVYLGYLVISSNIIQTDTARMIRIHFFPWEISLVIIACSLFVGWLGCSLSLTQFLKKN